MILLSNTESLCPICFRRIPAKIIGDGDGAVYLEKSCSIHGYFKTKIWTGINSWLQWDALNDWEPEHFEGELFKNSIKNGCPFDCGLCPAHLRKACFVVMEVTNRCNLTCPVCFANANQKNYSNEPDLRTIEDMYKTILEFECGSSVPSIQISGGEPTIRDDLPEIISAGKKLGLDHILLDTNGIRIAKDLSFLQKLKESGLDALYLQFDGVSEDAYLKLRGVELMECKNEAIKNCAKVDIGVVLVPTIVKEVNFHQIGGIIDFAIKRMPTVRGVMFQPISYFGRYPHHPNNFERTTIPDMLKAIEIQTGGKIKTENFVPIRYGSGCETHCGFACMIEVKSKEITPLTYFPREVESFVEGREGWKGPKHERKFIRTHWSPCACFRTPTINTEKDSLSIAGMHFQDVWNIDIRRVKKCCIHVVTPNGHLIPFCMFNITNLTGNTYYRDEVLKIGSKV